MAELSDDGARSRSDRSQFSALPEGWHYETTVAEVERIIEQIEMGELELSDVFEQFAAAVRYIQQCEAFLAHHQQQVDVLIETISDDE